jgi:L-alanine-DL-glutamate epimerase-like enolase superfamily enzyme
MIETIVARPLSIPFRSVFSHASASRDRMQSLWVDVRLADATRGQGEGCPREYVTGESLDGALAFVAGVTADLQQSVSDLASLKTWTASNARTIDANPAAWCAIELAVLDAFARRAGLSIEAFLNLPKVTGTFSYSAVIGDSPIKRFQAELQRYREVGFHSFKIKLAGDRVRDLEKIAALRDAGIAPESVRADANNLWSNADDAIESLLELGYAFWALEEPLQAGDLNGMGRIASETGASIILDESLLRAEQLPVFAASPASWIANLRVSKMGGLIRSLDVLERIRTAGLRVIVGAHVGETSLLTRAALTVANAAGGILVAQEGAFGTHLLEHDVIDPPIMFGARGRLDARGLPAGPGLGMVANLPSA